ncbi:hypothetical protein [Haliea sp. E17]|uniref:hypothetical protein n=1 Tax=Haliea sp. E17 TaxID=3401576 RepID=UPI003AAC3730
MIKLAIIVALVAAGYWYYSGAWQARMQTPEQQAQDNARLMERCMREEGRMAAGAGLAGMASETGDLQTLCADKLALQMRDGQWIPR